MGGFLVGLIFVLGVGTGINIENSGVKPTFDSTIEAIEDAYETSGPITQDIYNERFND